MNDPGTPSTRDRSSLSASDHERLDAIQPDSKEWWQQVAQGLGVEIHELNARLAALEHERDDWIARFNKLPEIVARAEDRGRLAAEHEVLENLACAIDEREHREHAEAALLSLQTAMREKVAMFTKYRDAPMNRGNQAEVRGIRKTLNVVVTELAALLPDPAGTKT